MSRGFRVLVLVTLGTIGTAVAELVDPGGNRADLALLAAGLAIGELLELRPVGRNPLPLSFAIVVVLARGASPVEFVAVVVVAYGIGCALRTEPPRLTSRALLFVERIVAALAAGLVYRVIIESAPAARPRELVLGALAAAAVAPIVVSDAIGAVRGKGLAGWRVRGADLALVTSGMLMAVGYDGIGGDGRLGLWGPILFSIPLLAAWYAFELHASIRRSFRQTVRALGSAPELGGLVRPGHGERVADLAVAMGRELDLSTAELEQLETAALLHHLGIVCLDEPSDGQHHDADEVARAGAAMLRASEALAPAGDIVAAELTLHRPPGSEIGARSALAGQILKVASAFDELTEGKPEHAHWAVEALYTGPGYVYDGRVLGALERALARAARVTA